MVQALRNRGVQAALLAALLFGAGTPIAKLLLGGVSPWMLAGLLYCGSGIGLGLIRLVRRSPAVRLQRRDLPPLLGAIVFGGIIGPVLLMFGLVDMPASGVSLLLNAEGVFTALLAWWVFKEHFDRRIGLGMLAIVAGAVLLSVPSGANLGSPWPALAVLGACFAWGLDNNLTRKVSLHDATWLACVKGVVAGPVNLMLAYALGTWFPTAETVGAAVAVGFLAYGVSLVLFIVAMRNLGTARAGAYFSIAPFFGAAPGRNPWRCGHLADGHGRSPHGNRCLAASQRAAPAPPPPRPGNSRALAHRRRAPSTSAPGAGTGRDLAQARPLAPAHRPLTRALPGCPPPPRAWRGPTRRYLTGGGCAWWRLCWLLAARSEAARSEARTREAEGAAARSAALTDQSQIRQRGMLCRVLRRLICGRSAS